MGRFANTRRPKCRFRPLVVEPLEDRSLLSAIITVNSVADTNTRDDALTLREAILINNRTLDVATLTAAEQAQVSGTPTSADTDTISFNIPGSGVHTISLASALPTIIDPVVIDGYTQPEAIANTNAIDNADPAKRGLNGTLLIELAPAAGAAASSGLTIAANDSTIRGLIIGGFADSGIVVTGDHNVIAGTYVGVNANGLAAASNGKWGILLNAGASGNRLGTNGDGVGDAAERNLISGNGFGGVGIVGVGSDSNIVAGNFIGTDSTGTTAVGNANRGVDIHSGAQNNRVGTNADGGNDAAERNILSGNLWDGVAIYNLGTAQNVVAGNWIGVDVTGAVALGNVKNGVAFFDGATSNIAGGATDAERNVISANQINGVLLSDVATASNIVAGNFIGTDAAGAAALGNKFRGLNISGGASNNTIGGLASGAGNVIAYNVLAGIRVNTATPASVGNAILQNAIFSNGSLGIALADDGVTPNDSGDADTGPNNFQNFPEIGSVMLGSAALQVTYVVTSTPGNSTYPLRIEFFQADPSGQGKTYLGSDMFTAADLATGGKSVVLTIAAPLAAGDKLVATATDSTATGAPANTSEFSPALAIVNDPWYNRIKPLDVDGDTHVFANDALAVINYLNAFGPGAISPTAVQGPPYYDTNGDTLLSAVDALLVINVINAGLGGEGERQGGSAIADGEQGAGAANDVTAELIALLAFDFGQQPRRRK